MRRFFLDAPLKDQMFITGQDAHHISRVLRLGVGDVIVTVAPDGQACMAKIEEMAPDKVMLMMQEEVLEEKEAPVNVYLAQGLPKSDKMDFIVQKAVELGVKSVYPMDAEHCVVQYDLSKKKSRRERWQKIAVEAAKQCGRSVIPTIEPILGLSEILMGISDDTVILMLYEGESVQGLKQALVDHKANNYLLLVGPEGGFSAKEVALCHKHGALVVTMGPRILRTETAALAGLSIIMYEHGDLGG